MRALTIFFFTSVLVVLFIKIFVVKVESSLIGPHSAEEVDDLKITGAYLDPATETLFLVASARWTQLDLAAARRQAAEFKYSISPRPGNFVHWLSLREGSPTFDSARVQPVAVLTKQYASFNYKYDGHPRRDHDQLTEPPEGFQYALFRSDPERGPDDRGEFKSYLLQTPTASADGRFGVQFFYHPDEERHLALQSPLILLIFGPDYLALCVALALAFGRTPLKQVNIFFLFLALLHCTWALCGFAAGLGGGYLLLGLAVLAILYGIRVSREPWDRA